jgi:hypothetical protein
MRIIKNCGRKLDVEGHLKVLSPARQAPASGLYYSKGVMPDFRESGITLKDARKKKRLEARRPVIAFTRPPASNL